MSRRSKSRPQVQRAARRVSLLLDADVVVLLIGGTASGTRTASANPLKYTGGDGGGAFTRATLGAEKDASHALRPEISLATNRALGARTGAGMLVVGAAAGAGLCAAEALVAVAGAAFAAAAAAAVVGMSLLLSKFIIARFVMPPLLITGALHSGHWYNDCAHGLHTKCPSSQSVTHTRASEYASKQILHSKEKSDIMDVDDD